METIHDRLRRARELAGYSSAAKAAERLGVKYGTYSGHENGSRGVKPPDIAQYARAFKVSPGWLQFGGNDGPVEPDNPPESIEANGTADAARRFETRRLEPGEVVEREVTAGLGIGGHSTVITVDGQEVDEVRAVWRLPPEYLHSELRSREADVDLISVEGDSMVPTLTPGDRVLINRRHARPGDGLFAIHDGFGVSVKRLEIVQGANPPRIIIKSDNEHHGDHEILAEDLVVIGRVVCRITRL